MRSRVSRIFAIQVSLFLAIIFITSWLVFFQVSARNIEGRVISEFNAELKLWSNELYFEVLMDIENVKALSSRTMIRQELYRYYNGTISLNELRNFTGNKYIEGASVYNNIIFAERTDDNGILIAEYKGKGQKPKAKSGEKVSFFKSEQGCNVLIENPIVQNDTIIGTDRAAFFLMDFSLIQSKLLEAGCIKDEPGRSDEKAFSGSVSIGDTGYYFYAELNQKTLRDEKRSAIKAVLLQTALLFAAVLLISYFTIFRLFASLMGRLDIANSRLSVSLKERDLLLQELKHRIKNNLAFITSYISIQKTDPGDEKAVHRNEQLINKVEAISLVYEKLQPGIRGFEADIGMYLNDLCQKIIEASSVEGVSLSAENVEKLILPSKTVVTIGLIFSELVTNSLKHAKADDDLEIFIGVENNVNEIRLYYDDDGIPYPADTDFNSSGSMGMMIIKNLVEQLGGKLVYNFKLRKKLEIVFSGAGNS